jgi:membrane protease YdiL (CAAX protease family)
MLDPPTLGTTGAQKRQLVRTIGLLAAIVIVSDVGYYLLLPALGLRTSYNASSVAIALYYAIWAAIVLIAFRTLFRGWSPFESRRAAYLLTFALIAALTTFAVFLLPALPPMDWREPWSPPELPLATPWYFLPKSVDILFQQLLIAALVLTFSALRYSLRTVSVWCALLFGAMHLLLAFGGLPAGYVIRFMVAAAAFGLIFPCLILRVPNGIAYSYMTHWGYYALSVAMAHAMYEPYGGSTVAAP